MMTIDEIMSTEVQTLRPDDSLEDANYCLGAQGFRHLPIVDSSTTSWSLRSRLTPLLPRGLERPDREQQPDGRGRHVEDEVPGVDHSARDVLEVI